MSGVNGVSSSDIVFGEPKGKKADNTKNSSSGLKAKLTQPVKDSFARAYGEDTRPTPSLVADFVSDNLVKAGVFIAGGALLLAKSRKSTNGLTKALKNNIDDMQKFSKNSGEKIGIAKKALKTISGTYSEIKSNNLKKAEEAVKRGNKSVKASIQEAILKPTEYTAGENSKLTKAINKIFGKHADNVKSAFAKVGIGNGYDLADTAIAAGATVALSGGVNEIAGDVTEKDNKELARQSKIKQFENLLDTAQKLADTTEVLVG